MHLAALRQSGGVAPISKLLAERIAAAYRASKRALPRPGDEAVGAWSRERLVAMDADFVERMRAAIERGLERPPEDSARAA
jgi:hypothetical protein